MSLKRIFGKAVSLKEVIPIKNIFEINKDKHDEKTEFTIKGELFSVQDFVVGKKKDKRKYIGVIGDKDSEIGFQLFTSLKKFPDGIPVKSGIKVIMHGNCVSNQYTNHELTINVKGLSIIEEDEQEENKVDEKRVELQVFTQYSKMRSGLKIEELFERAKKLGMTHIAITDLNGVHSFPYAYQLSQKYGVQLIYGATMLLAPDNIKTVYGPIPDKSLKDVTYVSFDVETTGLSASSDVGFTDHIIEIGATKFKNGKLVDSFQCFVKSPKPVSKFITELTGITQEQVDTYGIPLEEAVEQFDNFAKDAILIAHNATFDRDHMYEAYRRVGRTMPDFTIVDTLELDRIIEPDVKSHSLDNVCKRYSKTIETELKDKNKELRTLSSTLKKKNAELIKLKRKLDKEKNDENIALYNELNKEITDLQVEIEKIKNEINSDKQRIENLYLENHHRANEDAQVTGYAFLEMLNDLEEKNILNFQQLNDLMKDSWKNGFPKEITLIAQNETGKKNLMKIITEAHTKYLTRQPTVTKDLINTYREGILVGSGSHDGPLFELVANKPIEQAEKLIHFFDFVEIQPSSIASFLVSENKIESLETIESVWKRIYLLAKKVGKPVVATGHVHYLDEVDNDIFVHNTLLYHQKAGLPYKDRKGRIDALRKGRYLRTTQEMMKEFNYLNEKEKEEVIITNPRKIAENCKEFSPLPKGLFTPKIEGGNEKLRTIAYEKAESMYGKPLPEYIEKRLKTELDSIIKNGYSVIYLISRDLVKHSEENGYLVGSRGSVGSSFVATMTGITEVNPLKPHYYSTATKWSVFFDHAEIASGYDLPDSLSELFGDKYSKEAKKHFLTRLIQSFNLEVNKENAAKVYEICKNHKPNTCPITGKENSLKRDGQDIPFETFLGFDGDKVPDIDLNFSGEFQTKSHKYVEKMFGERHTFRAGTIGTVASKMAYGNLASYNEDNNLNWSRAKIIRLTEKIQGAKRTTGQHPGAILVVPKHLEVEDFTPLQHPAETLNNAHIKTSHFDYRAIEENILKLDILGHDDPTLLKMLQDITGVNPKEIPVNDEKVLKLFGKNEDVKEALGIDLSQITAETGTLGVPEFGTPFVQKMILATHPSTFAELVKISGLSHGTDVWLGNAEKLINRGICTLSEVIDTRDNIMVYLMQKGLNPSLAFTIMESVRKGKGLKEEWISEMKKHDVPDWYIDSCQKIKYMFPKAHAAAYVLAALRVAYFKVYYPEAFYTAILSVKYNKEDWNELNRDIPGLFNRIKEIQAEIDYLEGINEQNKAKNYRELLNAMELILEAKQRGVKFGNLDIMISDARNYIIKDGIIYPPLTSIPGVDSAAESVVEARKDGPFRNQDDILARTDLSNTAIQILTDLGVLNEYIDYQYTLF